MLHFPRTEPHVVFIVGSDPEGKPSVRTTESTSTQHAHHATLSYALRPPANLSLRDAPCIVNGEGWAAMMLLSRESLK